MKVHLRMLGCRLNQAEIDMMARQLQDQGHEIVTDPAQAEQVIVNTCAVTNEASRSSRKLIRELNRENADAEISVTGCYAQIAPDDIAVLPGVHRVVDNTGKDNIVSEITGVPVEKFDHEPLSRDEAVLGAAGRTRAFIKVQDGCDNSCTFCITTVARGDGRSRDATEIISEINDLYQSGFQEAVLTGVHLGSYGHDQGDTQALVKLVRTILRETDMPRLRLSSLEPWDLAPDFFDLWADPRVCRHLHLPLQSGCDATLRRMRRHTDQESFRALVQAARERIPGLSITSDVIVGFPGETDEEWAISKAFIEEMQFAGLHIFRYSRREGTPAARMRGHLTNAVKKTRSAELHAIAQNMMRDFATPFIDQTVSILWEHITGSTEDGFINVGYTDNYIRARCIHPRVLSNHITAAEVIAYDDAQQQIIVKPILG